MKKYLSILMLAMLTLFVACGSDDEEKTVYTVSFETDGGSPVPSAQRVEKGNAATAPTTNPAKTGYVFSYWHLSGATTAYNFHTPVNDNFTLYAKWQEEATAEYWQVAWELNGGSWTSGDNHATQVLKGGTLAEPNAPTKSGNTFEGWYKESALTNKVAFPYSTTADITLYAKWTVEGGNNGDPSGYEMFTSISALKTGLKAHTGGNTVYKVGLKNVNLDNDTGWNDLGVAIKEAERYVDLNLSGCTGTTIPDGYTKSYPVGNTIETTTYGVFVDCKYLSAITLPETVKIIGKYAFYLSGLKAVTLPKGLSNIHASAFQRLTSLSAIVLPDGLKEIGAEAFEGSGFQRSGFESNGLTSITIPGSVTDIGEKAFYYCLHLTSVTVGEGVKALPTSAFSLCHALGTVKLPASLTTIGAGAFGGCNSLTETIVLATAPPSLTGNAFWDTPATLKIKVPAASVNAYKAATGWKDHANKIVANTN